MTRRELLSRLRRHARRTGQPFQLVEGARHTKVTIGDRRTVVPRHTEINDITARAILKQMGIAP